MIVKLNFIPSRIVFVSPELRLVTTSAARLICRPFRLATIASIIINIVKIGMAKKRDFI